MCNDSFDPADLSQVTAHMHAGIAVPPIKGKKVINNAREIYPYASPEFACGVHGYMSGRPMPTWPDTAEYRRGWMVADSDRLKDKYILEP